MTGAEQRLQFDLKPGSVSPIVPWPSGRTASLRFRRDASSGPKLIWPGKLPRPASRVAYSPAGEQVAASADDDSIYPWDRGNSSDAVRLGGCQGAN